MKAADVARRLATPLTAPAYPAARTRFRDREYLNIVYRTDPDALRAVVPEPLQIEEPLVRFEIMRMNQASNYGPYTEAGQVIPVRFGAERGEYLHQMYLDSFAATAAGRELAAYPKSMGSPALFTEHGALVGTLDLGSQRVATATMGYQHRPLDFELARAEIAVPTYMLKIVPGYDGKPRICELARTQITDLTIKDAWTGPARLQLFEHVLAPLADLPVREIVSASHIITDLTLAPLRPVHDYLRGSQS
ncbi:MULTISPECIES: acetoacetate decarboxylase [unclassified Crossiella]|uniref:acetoacetate decarboxylase n=1 Tax=unclassified Crossiella TaxID=2620835 RepID=UPI001FFF73DA|nr:MULTISPECIES: acetoacetate decarboxylase [unclassified Crossiella]MCK2238474.1 acetoacetate decarboxylase [Crossiella sp. S99.2]MCK2251956.1 acetoacetate decarboxylase [Crossiella sp. S99.1]